MKKTMLVAMLLAIVSVPAWGHAETDGTIGMVRNAAGSATVLRGGNVLPATTGTRLHVGDTLGTSSISAHIINSSIILILECEVILLFFNCRFVSEIGFFFS